MPDELIVPVAALPPATPFTCQVTAEFDDPVTVALKDCVAPARTFAVAGETVTVALDPEGGVLELEAGELLVVPVHPASAATASRNTKRGECREGNFLNFSIRKRTESAGYRRRIACGELCLRASRGTTVRKDKIRLGKGQQEGHYAHGMGSPSSNLRGVSQPFSSLSEENAAVIRNSNRCFN